MAAAWCARRPAAFCSSRSLRAQPGFVGGAVEDQHAVAAAEVLLVVVAHLGFIALEDRLDDLELLEQKIRPRRDRVGVALGRR